MNSTQCGVSKVLLLLIANFQLLGRLDPKWALFPEPPQFCVGSLEVKFIFLLQLNLFLICAKEVEEDMLLLNYVAGVQATLVHLI